jgi:hypothetical protein
VIVSAETAAELAGEAIANGEAFIAVPTSAGWHVFRGEAPGLTIKAERLITAYSAQEPVLVFCEPHH